MAGGINLYAYAGGDPVNASDPWGLIPEPVYRGPWRPTGESCTPTGGASGCEVVVSTGKRRRIDNPMQGASFASYSGGPLGAFASIADDVDRNSGAGGYDPSAWSYHDYTVTNLICPSAFSCGPSEIEDMALRFAIPGMDGSWRAADFQIYGAFDPFFGFNAGPVRFSNLGWSNGEFSTRNRTLPGHLLHEGQITRTFFNVPGVGWHVRTHGVGQNQFFYGGFGISAPALNVFSAAANQRWGQAVFTAVDYQIFSAIRSRRP